jgi:hypothetical protein
VKAIARLFADMGDSYVELIATGIYFSYLKQLVQSFCLFFSPWGVNVMLLIVHFSLKQHSAHGWIAKPVLYCYLSLFQLISIFGNSPLFPGSDESMIIVNALLEVASHPEYDIASMTFNFWHNLQHILTKRWIHMEFYFISCILFYRKSEYNDSNLPGIPILHLAMKYPLKLREVGGCKFFTQPMSPLCPWWVFFVNKCRNSIFVLSIVKQLQIVVHVCIL